LTEQPSAYYLTEQQHPAARAVAVTAGVSMASQPRLLIYALGQVQVFRDGTRLTDWAYRDSEELLFYLIRHTHRTSRQAGLAPLHTPALTGRTREQIGLELWPDASPQQLSSKLKSRLYDLRRVLGDGAWILFEEGQYKFNATLAYWFDVEVFEAQAEQAKRVRAANAAEAIACLQQATQLYQGDFLEGLRQPRRRAATRFADDLEGSAREWQIVEQESLQRAHRDALHTLGQLLVRTEEFSAAADVYRQAVLKDDYDDEAHHGVIHALALLGKRSQALEHYRKLAKRREDTPPGPEILALAQRLKRGEELAPRVAAQTAPGPALSPLPRDQAPAPPFQVPEDLPRFVGRALEVSNLAAALTRAAPEVRGQAMPRRYCLAGMGGIGKTTLAVHLAHALRAQFSDGVLWAHVSTSEPLAILDSWARAFQCDFSGLPDLESRAAALRAVLADKHVLIIMDDVWSAERGRALFVGGPQSAVVLTTRDLEIAEVLECQIITLPLLTAEESRQLLARGAGPARMSAEPAAAEEICRLLGHLPLALEIAAHRLASRPRWLLGELADRLRVQHRRLAELKIGDQAVRASFAISWEALEAPLRRAFALLGVFGGRAFTADALGAVAELETRAAVDQSDALVALSLLSLEGSRHYRQHPLLAEFSREQLEQAPAADARMTHYYLRYATEQRQNYLALEEEWDNLSAGLNVAQEQHLWQVLIDYGDVLTNAWFARGRFSDARRACPLVCGAARALEEQDAYITATINWARACIEQGDYAEAKERLLHARQTCQEVNDQHGLARTQFHLGRVALEQSSHEEAAELLSESQRMLEKLADPAGVGETLLLQARIEYRHYHYLEVERLAKAALALLAPTDKYQQTIEVFCLLALAAGHQGQATSAEEFCQQAARLCDEAQYRSQLPILYYTWMQLCWRRQDFKLATHYGERSIELYRLSGELKARAYALDYLMRVYLDLQDYDLAEARGRQSLAILQEFRDDWDITFVLRDLGKLFQHTHRGAEARQVWTEALEKARSLKHPLEDEIQGLLHQI
jgi:DNA-binding SARP family transcriptional activator